MSNVWGLIFGLLMAFILYNVFDYFLSANKGKREGYKQKKKVAMKHKKK